VKRIAAALLALMALATLGLSQGCASSARDVAEIPDDYAVAVVRTSDYADVTYIEYYDQDLNLVRTTEYPYACVENMADILSSSEGVIYSAHRGSIYERNGGQALGITPRTGEIREYPIDQPAVAEVTATKDTLFATGGVGDISYIAQVDKETGESKAVTFEGCFLHSLATDGEKVIVVQDFLDNSDNTLLVFTDPANIEKRIKVTGLGYAGPLSDAIDGNFYFSGERHIGEKDVNEYTFNRYSPLDDSITTILKSEYPLRFVVACAGYLFLMQQDVNATEQSKILIIDKNTEKLVGEYPVSFVPQKMGENNGFLYLLGYDRYTGSPCFAQYAVDGSQLTKSHENNLSLEVTEKGKFFSSGMFFNT
jgi:hypothetical protein